MVPCYSASNETDISNVRFSSSLLTLPSIRSSGRNNHVRWLLVHLLFTGNNQICAKSPPVPSPVGLMTPPPARAPQPVAHRNPLPLVWCHCCKSRSHPSRLNHNPQPWPSLLQMPESWGNNMFKCCSAAFSCCFLIVWLMIFQFDSCRKGKIRVICISGKLLMWGVRLC